MFVPCGLSALHLCRVRLLALQDNDGFACEINHLRVRVEVDLVEHGAGSGDGVRLRQDAETMPELRSRDGARKREATTPPQKGKKIQNSGTYVHT